MTKEQFERWKDFALRMAKTCWTMRDRPNRQWVIEHVTDYFMCLQDYSTGEPYDWVMRVTSWDDTDNSQQPKDGNGHRPIGPFVCDDMTEWAYNFNPYYHSDNRAAYEQFDEQWIGAVSYYIQAGLDMVAEPSAGVLGYTVGDIRRMYPEGVPDWIKGDKP